MTRYFFDVTEQTGVRYDYSGRTLPSLDDAREFAELIAIDLGCRESEKAPGTFVLVRDAAGQQLITVEVQAFTSLVA